jgi:L-amino acid N-acyltransferase
VYSQLTIRRATPDDLEAITEIYNDAIRSTTATFDTEPKSLADRRQWLETHGERHPVLVAELEGQVVGWSSLSRWSDRLAYADTAETTFYVHPQHRGQGIGRRLKEATVAEARRLGFHTLIARVAEGSVASLHLNESLGFVRVGTLREVGRKFGRLLDVHILQKMLTDDDASGASGEENDTVPL